MFVSTDARRPYPRGVMGSTVGAYPGGTGSNPVEVNGHFFPHTVSSIFRLSLTRFVRLSGSLRMLDVVVPQIGVGVFQSCMIVSQWS